MYRSDVVGSLLRPAYLKEARDRFADGTLNDTAFKQVEDRAVDECIDLQTRAGMEVITDGEVRRYAFYGHLIDAVEGFDKYGGWAIPFRDEKGEKLVLSRPVVVSKLRRKRPLCAEEFTYLRARTKSPSKTTIISAQQAAAYYDSQKSTGAYATVDAYLADLVDILRDEVAELIRLGCTYIQIDSPQYTALTIPTGCWIYRLKWTTRWSAIIPASFLACICAAEIIRASSTPLATMVRSQKCFAIQNSRDSCSSMTTNAPVVSNHCVRYRKTAPSCSVW
jgi:hypothetical protein